MLPRLFGFLALASLTVSLASAQDKPADAPKGAASTKAKVAEALQAAGEDIPKAIEILQGALKDAPDDRNALFLLGAMSVVQGDKADSKADRIAAFRRSTKSFARLQELHKDLTPNEKRFLGMSRIGEARVLAGEGKPDEALALIKKGLAAGSIDLETLDSIKDLDAVRKLPAYKVAVEEAVRAGIVEEMASFDSFPFDFKLNNLEDKPVALADFKGKVTIVDIWGTWCPPCREEVPHFVDLDKRYKDKGLAIVGINCNEQGPPDQVKKTIKAFAKENGITYPCVLNDEKTEEKVPNFQGYPTTLFIDRAGKVRMLAVGNPGKDKLEGIVKILLAEETKP